MEIYASEYSVLIEAVAKSGIQAQQIAAIGKCDVLLIPVGGTYTLDPAEAKAVADALNPRIIVPMHYRRGSMGFDVLRTVEEFTAQYPAESVNEYDCSTLTVDETTPGQVAVLRV